MLVRCIAGTRYFTSSDTLINLKHWLGEVENKVALHLMDEELPGIYRQSIAYNSCFLILEIVDHYPRGAYLHVFTETFCGWFLTSNTTWYKRC